MGRNEATRALDLERALAALQPGTGPAAHFAPEDAELAELFETARRVRAIMPPASPSPRLLTASPDHLWQRLGAVRMGRRAASSAEHRLWRGVQRLAFATVAVALALATTTAGAVYAARDTVRGDTLYAVKRAAESVRLQLTHGPEAQAVLLADLADERLREADRLAALGRAQALDATLLEYQADMDQASGFAAALPDDRREAIAAALQLHLQKHIETLERVRTQAPLQAVPAIDRAIQGSSRSEAVLEALQHGENPGDLAPGQQARPTRPAHGQPPLQPSETPRPPKGKSQGK
jgi:hypothetical protein